MNKTSRKDEESFINLNMYGEGYLYDICEVPSKEGEPFLVCKIDAKDGRADDPEIVLLDCIVVGNDAQEHVRCCKDAVKAEKGVEIRFKVGGIRVKPYSKKSGEPDANLNARLLLIYWIKVDGEEVYKIEPKAQNGDESSPKAEESGSKSRPPSEKRSGKSSSAPARGNSRNGQSTRNSY